MRPESRNGHGAQADATSVRRFAPPAPRTIHECGLGFGFLVELTTKLLFQDGQLRLVDLVRQSKLPAGIIEPVLGFLRAERLCEVAQRNASHADISYQLTELGRGRADEFLRRGQYAGPAPVSLASYVDQVARQSALDLPVTRDQMRAAFAGCIVGDDLLDHLGVAMNSRRTVFLHGPAGSGKTFAGTRLVRVYAEPVYVPYAIAVGTDVVEMFDPLIHRPLADPDIPVRRVLDRTDQHDERWILCHRPAVVCGGELAAAMLDLEFDEGRRVHILPAHIKANNGVLVIDDLGRQLVHVRDLLNRWILPLDSGIDYMTLRSGRRFRVPVDVKVVFCTNLQPSQIGDEAFLRRLGYKVYVGALAASEYRAIFGQVCEELRIPYTEAAIEHLLARHRISQAPPLLASIPREILEQVRDCARYLDVAPQLNDALLDWAWDNRFAPDRPVAQPRTVRKSLEGTRS